MIQSAPEPSTHVVCAYLVQGSADTLARQAFPPGSLVYQLSYDRPATSEKAAESLFSNTASWAGGRNLLLEAALTHAGGDIDYFVFCDDDVVFAEGDFLAFERMLAETRPRIGFPLMPKAAQSPTLDPALTVQRALAIDEQMVAVHRSMIGERGIAPLIVEHDGVSWYVASLIFEYLCLTRNAAFTHQYNQIVVENDGHVWVDGQTLYHRGDFAEMLRVVEQALTDLTGGYDPSVIEQFDPAAVQNHAARIIDRAAIANLSRS
ncbi:hypothetical protein BH10PSE4_BH10PSE4_08650 [soil metagenome]